MSDSDRHHARPPKQPKPPETKKPSEILVLDSTQKGWAHRNAVNQCRALSHDVLHSVTNFCQAVRDITLTAPSHELYLSDEAPLKRLSADLKTLGQWVQTALEAYAARRATSLAPAPAPNPPTTQPPKTPATRSTQPTPSPSPAPAVTTSAKVPASTKTPQSSSTSKTKSAPPPVPAPTPSEPTLLPTPRTTPKRDIPATSRLFVRYRDAPDPQCRPHPKTIVRTLNNCFEDPVLRAVSYTRDNQLILHTILPFSAQHLIGYDKMLQDTIGPLLFPSATTPPVPTFDTGEAWSKVVLRGVPLPIWGTKSTVDRQLRALSSDLCASNNLSSSSVQLVRKIG
ncbi:hypothetical protein AURDEDRAFT_177671 [Auricularia subglabra TFB-10046 SS5]|uniref:Uncharacterized protein n=1 Tax=Auricularia subglabra (strain TFB-10046 / SS5) TaxID=717982 RepID=J0WN39_AURST|nr:hypothetical protein AURDEDRAFT_177671 [Auricularia subglabra TFB-10046 SS5]